MEHTLKGYSLQFEEHVCPAEVFIGGDCDLKKKHKFLFL